VSWERGAEVFQEWLIDRISSIKLQCIKANNAQTKRLVISLIECGSPAWHSPLNFTGVLRLLHLAKNGTRTGILSVDIVLN
jgi:hypothetical protein